MSEKDKLQVKEVDKSVKNKFSYRWLEKAVTVKDLTVRLFEDIKKINVPGQAQCRLCSKQINYGSRGFVAIQDHVKSDKHLKLYKERLSCHKVDKLLNDYAGEEPTAPPQPPQQNEYAASSSSVPVSRPLVPMCDRISNAEVCI